MWWNQNQCNHNNHNKGNIIYHSAKIGAQKSGHKNHGIVVRGCASHHHTTGLIPGLGVICAFSLSLVLFLISFLLKNKHSEFQFDLQIVDKNSHLVECQLLNPSCYPIPFLRRKCRLQVKTSRLSMKIYLLMTLFLIFLQEVSVGNYHHLLQQDYRICLHHFSHFLIFFFQ